MPAPYFLSAFILAAIVGMATGGGGAVVIPVFLVLWAIPHAFRLALWLRVRQYR